MKTSLTGIVSGTSALLLTVTIALRAEPTSASANNQLATPATSAANVPHVTDAPPLPPGFVSAPSASSSATRQIQTEPSGAAAPKETPVYADASTATAPPDGYTRNGNPFYRAYPNEGQSEEPTPYPAGMFNSSAGYPYGYNYDQGVEGIGDNEYLAPSYAPWGWGWVWPFGFGLNNFGFDSFHHRHFNHFRNGFVNHGGFNKNFIGHNNFIGRTAIVPHQSFHGTINTGGTVIGAHSATRGGFHSSGGHGGGHR